MTKELQQQITRLEGLPKFLEALAVLFCRMVLDSLERNTPGTQLPKEWTADIQTTQQNVTAKVWNIRVEQHPKFEEIMFYLDMGTSAHWVFPVNKLALSWVEDGIRYFSKGHQVSGITASHFHAEALRIIEVFEKSIPWHWDQYLKTGRLPK